MPSEFKAEVPKPKEISMDSYYMVRGEKVENGEQSSWGNPFKTYHEARTALDEQLWDAKKYMQRLTAHGLTWKIFITVSLVEMPLRNH